MALSGTLTLSLRPVLIFSKSVRLLKMLEYWLEEGGKSLCPTTSSAPSIFIDLRTGFTYQMLHGGCSQQERQEAIDDFQAGKAFVFLIS